MTQSTKSPWQLAEPKLPLWQRFWVWLSRSDVAAFDLSEAEREYLACEGW